MAKLSIITITYQAEKFLERTIQSILEQGHRSEIEYVIVDGASTDGTLALIHTYQKDIDQVISEKDRGIYDAMNKGLQVVNGEYVLFLNAGDTFAAKNTLEHIQSIGFRSRCTCRRCYVCGYAWTGNRPA